MHDLNQYRLSNDLCKLTFHFKMSTLKSVFVIILLLFCSTQYICNGYSITQTPFRRHGGLPTGTQSVSLHKIKDKKKKNKNKKKSPASRAWKHTDSHTHSLTKHDRG